MSVLHQNSGGIGKFILSAIKISLDPQDSGNLIGLGEGFPNTYIGGARIEAGAIECKKVVCEMVVTNFALKYNLVLRVIFCVVDAPIVWCLKFSIEVQGAVWQRPVHSGSAECGA